MTMSSAGPSESVRREDDLVYPTSCRRFSLADAMILVAAVGLGFAWERDLRNHRIEQSLFHRPAQGWTTWDFLVRTPRAIRVNVVPFLAVATPAFLVLRLRHPRPPLRRLVRQPGMVACSTALFTLLLGSLDFLVRFSFYEVAVWHFARQPWSKLLGRGIGNPFFLILNDSSRIVGYSVAASWMVVALGRHWYPEPGWIDRMGRILGVLWISLILVAVADSAIESFQGRGWGAPWDF